MNFLNPIYCLATSACTAVRRLSAGRILSASLAGIILMNSLTVPALAVGGKKSEYEEWGLTPPKATPSQPQTTPDADSDDWAEQAGPADTTSAIPSSPAPQATPAGPAVPADVAALVEGATVMVVSVDVNGERMLLPGWVVDRERGIVMTLDVVAKDAVKLYVAFPQVSEGDDWEGGLATLMTSNSDAHVVYLQIQNIPGPIPGLMNGQTVAAQRPVQNTPPVDNTPNHGGGLVPPTPAGSGHGQNGGPAVQQTGGIGGGGFSQGGSNPTVTQNSPVLGQWFLQDNVNGTQIRMGAVFNAQGEFAVHVITVGPNGQQNEDSESGTYTVQGNTLLLQTSEGVERAPFWFENGYLCIQLPSAGTTFAFQQAA